MDFLKKAASEFTSKNENKTNDQNNVQTQQNATTTTEGQNTTAPTTNNTQSLDYGDKGRFASQSHYHRSRALRFVDGPMDG